MQERANENYKSVIDLIKELQSFYDEIYEQYEPMAELLCKRNATETEAADFLEKLLDFCMDEKFVSLYKTVCRRYYTKYTQMISEYVYLYLDLYQKEETDDEMESKDECEIVENIGQQRLTNCQTRKQSVQGGNYGT